MYLDVSTIDLVGAPLTGDSVLGQLRTLVSQNDSDLGVALDRSVKRPRGRTRWLLIFDGLDQLCGEEQAPVVNRYIHLVAGLVDGRRHLRAIVAVRDRTELQPFAGRTFGLARLSRRQQRQLLQRHQVATATQDEIVERSQLDAGSWEIASRPLPLGLIAEYLAANGSAESDQPSSSS